MAATFEVRDQLMRLLGDDMTAFKLAIEWVDSDQKLIVFTRKYNEQPQNHLPEQRVVSALATANKLWGECYTAPVSGQSNA